MTHTQLAAVISLDQARQTRRDRPSYAPPDKPVVMKGEIAKHFKVDPRTIQRWMDDLGMPFIQRYQHGSLRFHVPNCDEWFRRLRNRAAPLIGLHSRDPTEGYVPAPTPAVCDEPWIKRGELAKRMGVTTKTIQRYEDEGMP